MELCKSSTQSLYFTIDHSSFRRPRCSRKRLDPTFHARVVPATTFSLKLVSATARFQSLREYRRVLRRLKIGRAARRSIEQDREKPTEFCPVPNRRYARDAAPEEEDDEVTRFVAPLDRPTIFPRRGIVAAFWQTLNAFRAKINTVALWRKQRDKHEVAFVLSRCVCAVDASSDSNYHKFQ